MKKRVCFILLTFALMGTVLISLSGVVESASQNDENTNSTILLTKAKTFNNSTSKKGTSKDVPKQSVGKRILFIGNSKSCYSQYREYVTSIAFNSGSMIFEGKKTSIDKQNDLYRINYNTNENFIGTKEGDNSYYTYSIGGSTLSDKVTWLNNGKYSSIDNLVVDYVVLQEGRGVMRNKTEFYNGARAIIEKIYKNNLDVKIFVRDVWGVNEINFQEYWNARKNGMIIKDINALEMSNKEFDLLVKEGKALSKDADEYLYPATITTKDVVQSLNAYFKPLGLKNDIRIIEDGKVIFWAYKNIDEPLEKGGQQDTHKVLVDLRHQNYLGAYAAALAANKVMFGVTPIYGTTYIPPEIKIEIEKTSDDKTKKYTEQQVQTIYELVNLYN